MQNKTSNSPKLNHAQVAYLVDQAERKFDYAAKAWINGNNSGNNETMRKSNARCDKLRREGEALLKPYGIKCDYPGLYPSFKVKGYDHHSVLSAISAALEETTEGLL